ncbi:hypothetical protein [Nesterenkonia ebinurensis]|uniref:hypothetical protein n=1 Tax=Nesterenkonia ebinurensis TaxID=2608252 RepID=UPI00123E1E39|nr:hypothetical protein [Nesterenkonia ebinurensis]
MNQRRRASPAVYRRRRLVAALLAVLLLALAIWGMRTLYDRIFGDDPEPAGQTEEQTENDDARLSREESGADSESTEEPAAEGTEEEPSAPEDPAAEGDCAAADIEVRASTSHESYDAATAPMLIMEIENTGSSECILDAGTAEQQFSVSLGGREIFTTAQCDIDGESLEIEFEPGQTERANMVWPRSESAVDCAEPAELVTGDYELTVSVSGITSEPHTFHVTGASQ